MVFGGLAQLGERLNGIQEVTSSSLVSSTCTENLTEPRCLSVTTAVSKWLRIQKVGTHSPSYGRQLAV